MFDSITQNLSGALQGNPWIALLAVFAGGVMTAAAPCVLVMVPLMIGFVIGQERAGVMRSFLLSLVFSIGLTIMFSVMFFATWAASSLLRVEWWTYLAAAVCVIMGLHLVGILRWRTHAITKIPAVRSGFVGALLLGLLFGLVSLPCAGPVLLALLAVVPLKGAAFGGALVAAYSLGHCCLILLGGTSIGVVQKMADSRGWNRGVDIVRRAAGVLILAVGVYLLTV